MSGYAKADSARMAKIKSMPCICCGQKIWQPNITEVHHLVDKGTRKASGGHQATIPLCQWHHRAIPRDWDTDERMMLSIYGPSLKFQGGKGKFVERWGTERELLPCVNELLGEV